MSFKKKIFLFLVLPIIIIALLYAGLVSTITNRINSEYAGKVVGDAKKLTFKFTKVAPILNFLQPGIRIYELVETNPSGQVSYSNDFYVYYDLLTQTIKTSIKGPIIAKFHPINSGFGARVEGEVNLKVKYPLSMKMLDILKKDDKFEMINFIDAVEFLSSKLVAYDLVDNDIVYEQKENSHEITLDKKYYYKNIEELTKFVPQAVRYKGEMDIVKIKPFLKLPYSVSYFSIPFNHNINKLDADIKFKTSQESANIEAIINNMELDADYKLDTKLFESKGEIEVKNHKVRQNSDNKLQADIKLDFKDDFKKENMQNIQFLLKVLTSNEKISIDERKLFKKLHDNLGMIIPELNKLGEIKFIADLTSKHDLKQSVTNVKRLDFKNDSYRITLNNKTITNVKPRWWTSKGALVVYNYEKFVDLFFDYISSLNLIFERKLGDVINISDTKYRGQIKQFLSKISDHHKDVNKDLYFEIDLSSDNNKPQKFGILSPMEILKRYQQMILSNTIKESMEKAAKKKMKLKDVLPDILKGKAPQIMQQLERRKKNQEDNQNIKRKKLPDHLWKQLIGQ